MKIYNILWTKFVLKVAEVRLNFEESALCNEKYDHITFTENCILNKIRIINHQHKAHNTS